MKSLTLSITLLVIASLMVPMQVQSQIVLDNGFSGDTIDTGVWTLNPGSTGGAIAAGTDELLITLPVATGFVSRGECYLRSVNSWARSNAGSVLRITFDVWHPYTGGANSAGQELVVGFYEAADLPHDWNLIGASLYVSWNDQNMYCTHLKSNDFSGGSIQYPLPEQYNKYRITLGAVDGALWEYDFGSGWVTHKDNRVEGSDTATPLHVVIDLNRGYWLDAASQRSERFRQVTVEYYSATAVNDWSLY